jgi:xanthine dehydrogenase accessory factor
MNDWRNSALVDDIRPVLVSEHLDRHAFALATLVEVDGPAPRDVGAQMVITQDRSWGFLSGGCIEADVARHGREAMCAHEPRVLRYGDGSPWIDIRLACGSGISVLVEPVAAGDPAIATLMAGYAVRTPVHWLSDGMTRKAAPATEVSPPQWNGSAFECNYAPSHRLIVIGEDATALATADLAATVGLDVTLVSENGATVSPVSGIGYRRTAPAEALADIGLDPWTAVAVVTHDREDNEAALAYALKSEALYVGAIGARVRLETRRTQLLRHGVDEAQLACLRAPIGLQGFGKSPANIALSIVAEVKRAFHSASALARSAGVSQSLIAPISSVSR